MITIIKLYGKNKCVNFLFYINIIRNIVLIVSPTAPGGFA